MKKRKTPAQMCSHCGKAAEGNYSIHDTPSMDGPEVPLCDACGSSEEPTCGEIWAGLADKAIAQRAAGWSYSQSLAELAKAAHVLMTVKEDVLSDVAATFDELDPYGEGTDPS